MTMHLVNGMSTTRTTQPQPATLTKAKRKELGDALVELNKNLKQQGRHNERMSFDEYLAYLHGRPKAKRSESRALKTPQRYRRESIPIPSLNEDTGVAPKKEPLRYTGTLVKGISTLHKSNAVPVINDEEILDIARMRRG